MRKSGRSFTTSSSISLKTEVTRPRPSSWPRFVTWVRCRSCARRCGDAAVGVSPRCGRSWSNFRSTPRRPMSRSSRSFRSSSRSAFCTCTRASSSRPPPGSRRRLKPAGHPTCPPRLRDRLTAVLGIVAMRRGEIENCLECVGPSSCIFPIAREAVHRNQAGSREAIRWFSLYLESSPRDLRVLWLLNIAYMTLGEYPEKVPSQYLIPIEFFRSAADVGRFTNVASLVGLTVPGAKSGWGQRLRRFQWRRPGRPLHHVARCRPGCLAVHQSG